MTTLVIISSPVGAQDAPRHQGFWIGFGFGPGWDLDAPLGDANFGGAGYLRLGGTLTPQLLIGGEASGWARDDSGVTRTRGNATATVLFYPLPRGGVFLKSGIGFGTESIQTSTFGVTTTVSDEGLGVTVGAGYDIKLGRNFYATPNVDFLAQHIGGTSRNLVLVTLGATWH
jgi:hypothetical protein